MTIVPPYCGTPSESHQFPVELLPEVVTCVVEAAVVDGADVVFMVVVVLEVLTGGLVVVVVVVVEDAPQDDKIMEVASRQHKINRVIFPFILSPFLFSGDTAPIPFHISEKEQLAHVGSPFTSTYYTGLILSKICLESQTRLRVNGFGSNVSR